MSKLSFRKSIFDVVEYVNHYELSDHAKKLIIHYFNESKALTSRQKAIQAIETYLQDKLPKDADTPPRLGSLLEVMMDEADDGFFLAQRFKKERPKIPILMYTSISKTIGLQFGANELVPVDDFVEKPISSEELIQKVKNLLN